MFSLTTFFNTSVGSNLLIEKNSKKKIAITMDDLPLQRIGHFGNSASEKIINKLIDKIKSQNTPMVGFVNEDKLQVNGKTDHRKVKLLESWLNASFDLGNHTFSHKSANEIPVKIFEKEILDGERVIRELIEKKGKKLKYFRHPFSSDGKKFRNKT